MRGRRGRTRARSAAVLATLVTCALAGQAATYTIRRGDTLSGIARRHGATVGALAEANGVADPDHIVAGRTLRLPDGARKDTAKPAAPATAAKPGKTARASSRLPARLRAAPERLALMPHFDGAARTYGVPADLLKALAWMESGWQNHKVSSVGARGIGQLMPATVAFTNDILLRGPDLDPGRADHNIRMSARFLRYLLDRTEGDVDRALAAYYQGLRSVAETGPKPHTLVYVTAVRALRARFR